MATQTIKITEIIISEVTIAAIPLTAIPIAITNTGFPEALAYPSLLLVLLNTFPCIDEEFPRRSEMLTISNISETNHIIIENPIIILPLLQIPVCPLVLLI